MSVADSALKSGSTSATLLGRLAKGTDPAAWDRFVRLYTPLLYYWTQRIGIPSSDAADLVQDVFILLMHKLPEFRYDQQKGFRGWLRTLLLNKWRETLRRNRVRARSTVNDQEIDQLPEPRESSQFWESEYRNFLVRRALELMQSQFQENTWKACWKMVVEGLSGAETARELGMTEAAVYVAKGRVLRALRVELRDLWE